MSPSPQTPRKVPRQARSRVTHESILEAATQILGSAGLKGFNTNAIAARAGTSIGSLYQYYANKDALMLALIHRQKSRMLDDVARAMEATSGDDLETGVRTLVRAVTEHARDDLLLAAAIDHEEARLSIDGVVDDYLRQGSDLFVRFFARYGELKGADLRRAARTVPVLVQAIMDHWSSESAEDVDLAEQEAVHAVLGYLRQSSASARPG